MRHYGYEHPDAGDSSEPVRAMARRLVETQGRIRGCGQRIAGLLAERAAARHARHRAGRGNEAAVAAAVAAAAAVDTDAVIGLGALALVFARVERITRHEDGVTPESDTDHTVMLGLIGCAFAAEYLPQLDVGMVAQYALVHDLVEAYAGDTPTLRIDTAGQASKQEREAAALARLHREFAGSLPWLTATITEYEARRTPEARYVKAMDKLVPKITHLLNEGATMRQQGLDPDEVAARYEQQVHELRGYAVDFPPLFELRADLVGRLLGVLAGAQGAGPVSTNRASTNRASTASGPRCGSCGALLVKRPAAGEVPTR